MVWVIVVRCSSCDVCESLADGDGPGVLLLLLLSLLSVDVAVDAVVRLGELFPGDEVVLGVDVVLSSGRGELELGVGVEEVVSAGGDEREGEGEGEDAPPPPVPGPLEAAPEFPPLSSSCLRWSAFPLRTSLGFTKVASATDAADSPTTRSSSTLLICIVTDFFPCPGRLRGGRWTARTDAIMHSGCY